ncbi:MAG: gamma-glutamylcyclotransferase [Candidatus Latescibacteria bacterium]|nr:gamma-glutamylcyclotransferase [Candidatus Latescibacterota bacterium]
MMKVLYFAYGSNMLITRLRSRISSAKLIDIGFLNGYKVLFNKCSKDGSGKANLIESPGDVTWGVIYEIDEQDTNKLDIFEGGYNREIFQICNKENIAVSAFVYLSSDLTNDERAYEWYKEIILKGARENNLPKNYISYLEKLPSKVNGI